MPDKKQLPHGSPKIAELTAPDVSILMVTFRRSPYLAGAVASLMAQTVPNWELIVVDDSETGAARPGLDPWLPDARIRYFHRPDGHSGYANALNYARAQSRSELLAILDDDDIWVDPQKLRKQIELLRHDPKLAVCGSSAIVIDGEGKQIGPAPVPETDAAIRSCILFGNAFINSSTVFRKSIGEYREDLQSADWELWLRAGCSHSLYNIPQALCAYRKSLMNTINPRAPRRIQEFRFLLDHYRNHYPGYWRARAYHFAAWKSPPRFSDLVRKQLPFLTRGLRRLLFPKKPQGAL